MKAERIKKTDIQKKLDKINKDEKYLTTLIKFLQSPKGQRMVNCIDRRPITALMREFEAPKASWRDAHSQYNLLRAAMKLAKVKPEHTGRSIVDYTHLLYDKQLKGELKLRKSLSHGEMKDIGKRLNWVIKKDSSGNPIIKTDSEGRKLYYKGSNNPVYKWTPRIKNGLALRMHMLEEHKMAKWDRLHPEPTSIELQQDLFPEDLLSGHRTARYVHLEHVREFLAVKYCNGIRKTSDLRVFEVYKNPSANGSLCEVERWEDAYCLTGLDKNTSNTTLKIKLENHVKTLPFTPMGKKTVGYKIYDNLGNLRVNLNVA